MLQETKSEWERRKRGAYERGFRSQTREPLNPGPRELRPKARSPGRGGIDDHVGALEQHEKGPG
eukprot:1584958-Alexandrium_andersonii.AAC.1